MPDDLKIPVTTPGAAKAKRDLTEIARAEKKVGQSAEEAGRKGKKGGQDAAEGKKEAARWTDRLITKVKALVGAYLGLRGAQAVLRSLREETEKIDEATRKAAESLRAVMALSTLKGERVETQQAIWQMAIGAGRPIEQVAPAYYTLLGGTAGMERGRQMGLMQQALTMAKTDPRASLEALVSLFSTIGTQQPDLTPQQIGNLVSKTIEQAKATPEEMAMYLPSILTTARAAGADVGTAAAMFTLGTRRGGGVATSGTAVRAAILGLLLPAPDVQKQLTQFGFPATGDILSRIGWLQEAGGQLPPELVAGLGGRRGIEAISAIAEQPGALRAEIGLMAGAMAAPGSLLQQRLGEMYGELPAQRYLEQLSQLTVLTQKEYTDPEALLQQAEMELVDLAFRRQGVAPWMRKVAGWAYRTRRGLGYRAVSAEGPGEEAFLGLLRQGYTPADILEHVLPTIQEAGGAAWERRDWIGLDWPSPPEGVTYEQWYQQLLQAGGAEPMQGTGGGATGGAGAVSVFQGGTHYHIDDRRDPAGRPVQRVAPMGY
ncbi:MAG TPA: phage tail tape measure protein [Phycisphaerae bacterium]|nr:phage tail tape measure protein [Phycisphaerae bacterium]